MDSQSQPNNDDVIADAKFIKSLLDFDDEEDDYIQKIIQINTENSGEKHYNRMGFFCAQEETSHPKEKLFKLINDEKKLFKKKEKKINKLYRKASKRINSKIDFAENGLSEIKAKYENHINEVEVLETEKSELKKELNIKKNEQLEISSQIGKAKENIINNRIDSVRKELSALIENYSNIYDQRYKINAKTFEDNEEALKLKTERFKSLKDQFEERQKKIVSRINELSQYGIDSYLANFLVTIGFASAVVAGYFFSIFALSKNLNDENIPFFLIQGFHNFINNVFAGYTIGSQFFFLVIYLFGIILVLTIITAICHFALNLTTPKSASKSKNELEKSYNKLIIEARDSENFSFESFSETSNFFQFWLKIIPILLLTGIVSILLLLGMNADDIKNLDTSLSGTVVGSILTFLMTGLVYLYIVKVIEPRVEKYPDRGFLQKNIELVLVFGCFVLSTLSMIFLNNSDQHDAKVIFEFVSIILMAAFLLGYAFRFRGLISTANFLDRRINALYDAIRDNSRPRPLNLTAIEDKRFKTEYLKLQKQLFELIHLRNDMTIHFLGNDSKGWTYKKNNKKRVKGVKKKWWSRFVNRNNQENTQNNFIPQEELINQFLPKENLEQNMIVEDINEIKARFEQLEKAIENRKEEKTEYCIQLKDHEVKWLNRIHNYKKAKERFLKVKNNAIRLETRLRDENITFIKEGFDLGMWYRENKLGPTEDYYTKGYPLTPNDIQNKN